MATDFGTDFATLGGDDLDPTFRLVTGNEGLRFAAARRFTTSELFYDATYGEDLRGWLGEATTAAGRARMQARLAAQALQDERIRRASARVTYTAATRTRASCSGSRATRGRSSSCSASPRPPAC
jgi:hypothetical protein